MQNLQVTVRIGTSLVLTGRHRTHESVNELDEAVEWTEFIESRTYDVIPPRRADNVIPIGSDEPNPTAMDVTDDHAAANDSPFMNKPASKESRGFCWGPV